MWVAVRCGAESTSALGLRSSKTMEIRYLTYETEDGMNSSCVRGAALTLVVCSLACADSTGVTPSDLEGTWTAQSVLFTNMVSSSETFDLIANGGSYAITLMPDGEFTSSFTFEQESESLSGTYSVSGSQITISESGQGSPETFSITRDGNTMVLSGIDSWDFDEDGTEEDATLVVTLTR